LEQAAPASTRATTAGISRLFSTTKGIKSSLMGVEGSRYALVLEPRL